MALESRYGARVDAALALKGVQSDDASRPHLLWEFRRAELAGSKALGRMLEGDFSDEEKPAYFPPFESPQRPVAASCATLPKASRGEGAMSIAQLFEAMREAMLEFVKPSTLRRYQSTIEKLSAFTDHADFRTLTKERVNAWIKHRTTQEGISKKTVRNNDLVAVQSVLNFAMTEEGGARIRENPIHGLKIKLPRAAKTKHERRFLMPKSFRSSRLQMRSRWEGDIRNPPRATAGRLGSRLTRVLASKNSSASRRSISGRRAARGDRSLQDQDGRGPNRSDSRARH